jgi:hypothetical protein
VVKIKIYIEGGGDGGDLKRRCRKGFREFLEKTGLFETRMPRIVASGSRGNAYDDFCVALKGAMQGELIILLIDSEGEVTQTDPWLHLKNRQGDGWDKPENSTAENLHFMAQCMESWFLADKQLLANYYGSGFNENALPKAANIEKISKDDVINGLRNATNSTTKGRYSKGKHSFEILGALNAGAVLSSALFAKRFIDTLDRHA